MQLSSHEKAISVLDNYVVAVLATAFTLFLRRCRQCLLCGHYFDKVDTRSDSNHPFPVNSIASHGGTPKLSPFAVVLSEFLYLRTLINAHCGVYDEDGGHWPIGWIARPKARVVGAPIAPLVPRQFWHGHEKEKNGRLIIGGVLFITVIFVREGKLWKVSGCQAPNEFIWWQ